MSTRYTIEGKKPGPTIYVAGRFVSPHRDGGYAFTQAQVEALQKDGKKLVVVKGVIPREEPKREKMTRLDSRARKAVNKATADEAASKMNRAPSKSDLAPKG